MSSVMLVGKTYNEPTLHGSLVINEAVFPGQQAFVSYTLRLKNRACRWMDTLVFGGFSITCF